MNYYTTIEELFGVEYEIEIGYSCTPFRKGAKDSYGVPIEPDEPAGIEIESVKAYDREREEWHKVDWTPLSWEQDIIKEIEEIDR